MIKRAFPRIGAREGEGAGDNRLGLLDFLGGGLRFIDWLWFDFMILLFYIPPLYHRE